MFGEERGIVAMPNAGGVNHGYDLAASVGSPKAYDTGKLNNLMLACGRTSISEHLWASAQL
jgi:hypothetical protein